MEVRLSPESVKKIGQSSKKKTRKKTVLAVADTGCQTTTAGIEILRALDVDESFLIPTKHKIIGITDTSLDIKGVLILDIMWEGKLTKLMTYVSGN